MALSLTLYINSYCHLCEEMLTALRQHLEGHEYQLDIIDIEGRGDLEQRYGELIPVLTSGGREICHYHLDKSALEACMASA